jgi:hypothetical protein
MNTSKHELKLIHRFTYSNTTQGGKLNNMMFIQTEKIGSGLYREISPERVMEIYKDLEVIEIDSLWQKYIHVGPGGMF